MKFAQIKKNGNIHLCVYENGFLYDLTQQNSPDMPHSLEELLSSGEELIAKQQISITYPLRRTRKQMLNMPLPLRRKEN